MLDPASSEEEVDGEGGGNSGRGGANATAEEMPPPPHPASLRDRFQPNGSIAVMVNSATTSALFHDVTPAVSTAAADTAALLLVVDTIARSLLPAIVNNGSLVRELLDLSPASETNATLTAAEEDALVLSALGQVYFFFFVGDDGAGFSGSGRFIKESLQFECRNYPKGHPNDPSGIDCNFPFYWFTNFTRTVELSNFTHLVALDGVLGSGGGGGGDNSGSGGVEGLLEMAEAQMLAEALKKARAEEEDNDDSSSAAPFISIDAPFDEGFEFYAYTDSNLDTLSDAQRSVNTALAGRVIAAPPSSSSSSKMNTPPLSLLGYFAGGSLKHKEERLVVVNSTVNATRTSVTSLAARRAASNNSSTCSSIYSLLNFTAVNISNSSGVEEEEGVVVPLHLTTTLPPSSLWSFMLAAYGDLTDKEVAESLSPTPPPLVPSGWRSRSFTVISAVKPDEEVAGGGGGGGAEDCSASSSRRLSHYKRFYAAGGAASTATLRTARSVSASLDSYPSMLASGGGGASTVVFNSTGGDTDGGNERVVSFRLSAASRAQLRRRLVHGMLAAVADVTANLILELLVEGSLRPAAAASRNPSRADKAIGDALDQIAFVPSEERGGVTRLQLALPASRAEAHRLFYCLGANTECAYMQGHSYTLGYSGRIPATMTDGGAPNSDTEDAAAVFPIAAANYYHTVFGFYRAIPAQQSIAQRYLADRLKSSYNQRIGAHKMMKNNGDNNAIIGGDVAKDGTPCDPFAQRGPHAFGMHCPSRYQQCLPNDMHTTAAAPADTNITFGCYGQAAFYSHAFAPATMYNPRRPSVASFVSDWAYINGVRIFQRLRRAAAAAVAHNNTPHGQTSTPPQHVSIGPPRRAAPSET